MDKNTKITWKETAWNSISFKTPVKWAPAKIGKSYLMLENAHEPVVEIKWNLIKGDFSSEKHLKRFGAAYEGKLGGKIEKSRIPEKWVKALSVKNSQFEISCFSWPYQGSMAKGLLIFCPACKKATMIRFFKISSEISAKILKSFKDHPENDIIIWSVFDIKAQIPKNLKFISHKFNPGQFEMRFETKGARLTLFRWGPASVIMSKGGLKHFAATKFGISYHKFDACAHDQYEAIKQKETGYGILGKIGLKKWVEPEIHYKKLWHIPEKNRILGILITCKKSRFILLKNIENNFTAL